jgi:hypothetical protein
MMDHDDDGWMDRWMDGWVDGVDMVADPGGQHDLSIK